MFEARQKSFDINNLDQKGVKNLTILQKMKNVKFYKTENLNTQYLTQMRVFQDSIAMILVTFNKMRNLN